MAPKRTAGRDEAGFTLVEVMATMVILVIGLLGLLTLVDRANGTTSTTLQREGATNLARELVERAQAVSYSSLTPSGASAALRTAADPTGSRASLAGAGSTWQIRSGRRGAAGAATVRDLSVNVTACSILAPSSRPRVIDSALTLCDTASGGGGGGGTTTPISSGGCNAEVTNDPVIGVTIKLLVPVNLCVGGALANAICTLLGPTEPLMAVLNPLISRDGAISVLLGGLGGSFSLDLCGGRPIVPIPGGSGPADSARRVTIDVVWGAGEGQRVRQTTVVARAAA